MQEVEMPNAPADNDVDKKQKTLDKIVEMMEYAEPVLLKRNTSDSPA